MSVLSLAGHELNQLTHPPFFRSFHHFGFQFGAQSCHTSRKFVEVDCCASPQPFQFDFVEASQQELSEANDMFDQGERRLGNPHPLIVFLFRGVFSHLGGKLVALRCVGVSTDGATTLVVRSNAS